MIRLWKLLFEQQPAEFLRSARGMAARRLRVQLERLLAHPLAEPDAQGRSADGREYYTRRTSEHSIAYWLDFPVREIRVIEILKIKRRRSP